MAKKKTVDSSSQEYIRDFFRSIPKLKPRKVKRQRLNKELKSFDTSVAFRHRDVKYLVVVDHLVRTSPQQVRTQGYELQVRCGLLEGRVGKNVIVVPMLFSPYFSPQCRELCAEHKLAFLDLCGNAQFIGETMVVTREVERKPATETRKLRSIFGPKAGAILRAMLLDTNRVWKVTELADASASSIGHVSNVRRALIEHEWAVKRPGGVLLNRPDLLLQTWKENYRKPSGQFLRGYTNLTDNEQDRIIRNLFDGFANDGYPPLVYGRNSAAQYYVSLMRSPRRFFYANDLGIQLLERELEISYVDSGENIAMQLLDDSSILQDSVAAEPHSLSTDPITTYLDLSNGNERDCEAAEVLARKYFPWLV